ncbi:MAG: hypothetical protein ACRDK0_01380, partial [Solirubrobacteraceae bacterium]
MDHQPALDDKPLGYSLDQAIAAADDPQYIADQYRAYVSSEIGSQIPYDGDDWFNRSAAAE